MNPNAPNLCKWVKVNYKSVAAGGSSVLQTQFVYIDFKEEKKYQKISWLHKRYWLCCFKEEKKYKLYCLVHISEP